MTAYKLKSWAPKESDLQGQVISYLRHEQARRRISWFCRVNGGVALHHRVPVANYRLWLPGVDAMRKGYADLHGMMAGGRYFALEIKRPGEEPTPEQMAFLDSVRAGGGIGAVARCWQDARSVLFDEREVD